MNSISLLFAQGGYGVTTDRVNVSHIDQCNNFVITERTPCRPTIQSHSVPLESSFDLINGPGTKETIGFGFIHHQAPFLAAIPVNYTFQISSKAGR
jgi:hypothetical protein